MDDDYTEEIEPHERLIFGRPYVGEEGGPGPIDRCDVTGDPKWRCGCDVCDEELRVAQAEQIWEMEMER